MTIISSSDISARLTSQQYLVLFDKDRDGTADASYLTTCINSAESMVRMKCQAYFSEAFDATGGTVDEGIKSCAVALACWEAVRFSPLATGDANAPFRQAYADAIAFLESLNRDDMARPVTSAAGRSLPQATLVNQTDESGEYTNVLSRVADRKDDSAF